MSNTNNRGDAFGGPRITIVNPSCGLCRFFFKENESAVIFNNECGPRTLEHGLIDFDIRGAEKGYHVDFVKLATPDLMISAQLDSDIWSATVQGPIGLPSTSWVDRRIKRLRNLFTPKLYDALQFRLPAEVCQNIAQHLTQESAVQALRDAWLGGLRRDKSAICFSVKESTTLYIGYIEIEGLSYVNSFSPVPSSHASVKAATFHKGMPVNVFIATGYLGGLKLRHLAVVNTSDEHSVYDSHGYLKNAQKLIDAFPHHSGQAFPSEIVDLPDHRLSCWLFMPIDPDERISDIWAYHAPTPPNSEHTFYARSRSLIIRTSNGRSLHLGPCLRESTSGWQTTAKYKAIAALPRTNSSRMFFANDTWRELHWVGFEHVSSWDDRVVVLPLPYTLPSLTFQSTKYFSTSAQLEGLLFKYSNGTRRSVGQARFDRLEPWVEMSGSICLAPDKLNSHNCCWDCPPGIGWFGLSAPLQESAPECLEVPRRGRLDWCFDNRRCHISHHDDSRVRDEMEEALSHEAETGIVCTKRPPGMVSEYLGQKPKV
ncbi:hypothetical protein FGRMN_944 [Fusarium graminum]|nr:hypothetical protein FGRMN_944 [Fusarium graminum]